MAETATLNVRMDAETKDLFTSFCDEIGVSASALMNMFAKTVVRNQRVPFALTTKPIDAATDRFARLFPSDEDELDAMLAAAEATPADKCVPANVGFAAFERHMGW